MRPVSNQALGRESLTCTSASASHSSWTSTTHCGSLKPRGLESSGGTSGSGTCMPSLETIPASVLVPLRPAPATRRTFRGTPSGFISSIALGCSVTAGSLPAARRRGPTRLGSGRMKLFGRAPLIGVVIPAYGVEDYLDDCVRSLLAQTHRRWEAVIVDDGSTDGTGEIADLWAHRDARISVVHTVNGGLGAARNLGALQVRGDFLAFLDSDDALPPTRVRRPAGRPRRVGLRLRHRIHRALGGRASWSSRRGCGACTDPCAVRGSRTGPRSSATSSPGTRCGAARAWDAAGLSWPEGVRYEDQPTTTRAFLDGTFDVLDEVVYHWRIREGSITQTRASSVQDLSDRWETKRSSLASVRAHGSAEVEEVFVDRVLAGRPVALLPARARRLRGVVAACCARGCWSSGGSARSCTAGCRRCTGWPAGSSPRTGAPTSTPSWSGRRPSTGRRPGRRTSRPAAWRLVVPPSVLDETTVAPEALALRDHEVVAG